MLNLLAGRLVSCEMKLNGCMASVMKTKSGSNKITVVVSEKEVVQLSVDPLRRSREET